MGGRGGPAERLGTTKPFPDVTRDRHFQTHGDDFAATSALEYEQFALTFAGRRGESGVESFVSARRVVYMYEPSTNTYLMHHEEGTLMTFMKPTSPTYWQRQRDKHEPK
jgi:pyocin large subunit-like protein